MENYVNNSNEFSEVARRISELREVCGYTQEELARELGIDIEVYKGYEADGSDIPISVIYEIANKFNIDFAEILTGVAAKLDTHHIVRAGKGKDVDRYPGYRYQDLAFRYAKKIMQPLLVTLDPSDEPLKLVSHTGQEFNMVLEGSIEVVFENETYVLNAGDTIYFNPLIRHGQRCYGDKTAKFLTVISE
ncbi:MAG: cupin domain-containing protein [Ruminococcaceae bacterium]|nr:cupin domain-containing protein [Oscillospiraceae bacterium]